MYPFMAGTMATGSTCSKCQKDISGQFGVELNGKDFCKSCADEIFSPPKPDEVLIKENKNAS